MRRVLISILIFVGVVGLVGLVNEPNEYRDLYEDLLYPSVRITVGSSTGSGVVIATTDYTDEHRLRQVYILTAAHVVGDKASVRVTFYDYRGLAQIETASVVITDTLKDLALLRIETTDIHRLTQIYSVKLAPRNYQPYLFTEIWAVGCSLGLDPRPSSGHICAICGSYWEMSAPIVPGNSGGGVFLQSNHQLIGIAVWVRVYREQLITTMAGIVPLQDIYEFLENHLRTFPVWGTRCVTAGGLVESVSTALPGGLVHRPY